MNNKPKKFDYLEKIKDPSALQNELEPLLRNHSAEDFSDNISRIPLEAVFRVVYGFYPQSEHGTKLSIVKQLQNRFSTLRRADAFKHAGYQTVFSKNFNRICKDTGISDTTIAIQINVDIAEIEKWRSGQVEPTISQLTRLCNLFELSADNFIFPDGKPLF